MAPISEEKIRELENQASYLKGEKARILRDIVASCLEDAEAAHAKEELIDRLDHLLLGLTEASRDVCTNTRCPHYGSKCKMR
jgi:citrate lyase beta subunit